MDTRILPSGRPYASPQAAGFEPHALIPECNAPSPVKGGGDVNLSGAAQQTHTNTQYRQYTIQQAMIREIHTGTVHKLRVLIRKCVNVLTQINAENKYVTYLSQRGP